MTRGAKFLPAEAETGRRATATIAVLGYHRVGTPPPGSWETWFSIPEDVFVEHLRYLGSNGWPVIGLQRLLDALDGRTALPERSVLITFDDGYKSIRDCGLRRLAEFGHRAVMFVPTDYVGGVNEFEGDTDEPDEPICDVEDLRALERAGISVEAHGSSHRTFSTLDAGEREREVAESTRVLEEALGKRVQAFSYPYGDDGGDADAAAELLERHGYRAGFLYGGGPILLAEANRFRLPRLALGPDTDLAAALGDA